MIVEPVVQIRYICTEPRKSALVLIFLKPCFRRPRHLERLIIAAGVEQRRDISEFGARRLSRFSNLLQPFEGARVIGDGFLILLVCSESVSQHAPGCEYESFTVGISGQLKSAVRQHDTVGRRFAARLARVEFGFANFIPDLVEGRPQFLFTHEKSILFGKKFSNSLANKKRK